MCFSKPDAAMMSQREQVAIQQGNSSNYHGGRVCVCVGQGSNCGEKAAKEKHSCTYGLTTSAVVVRSLLMGGKSSGYSQSSTQAQTRLGVRGVRG